MPNHMDMYSSFRKSLPVYKYRDQIIEAVRSNQTLVVVGETGSGKTTQIPQYLLEALKCNICVTQPRRIAAVSVAKKVSEEQNCKVGESVGYTVSFDDSTSYKTKLQYMTDGLLLKQLTKNPNLSDYDVVIVDEAHERSLETDVLLGLLKMLCKKRLELKLLVMSATLDVETFSDYFDKCPIFAIEGNLYNVDVFYQKDLKLNKNKPLYIQKSVETALYIHLNESEGDILIFLTGRSETEEASLQLREQLKQLDADKKALVLVIHSGMDSIDQDLIFNKAGRDTRKIIFSTNISQTSITIPNIKYVIDCGFVKQKFYDMQTGMDALLTVPITKAAAIQRSGRAGRVREGKVFRLYSKKSYEDMQEQTIPDIQRSNLLNIILSMKCMNIDDVLNFEFIDSPDRDGIIHCLKILYFLEAIDENGKITQTGLDMKEFEISPYLSRSLIEAVKYECTEEISIIAGLLSVQNVMNNPNSESEKNKIRNIIIENFKADSGDHLTLYNIYKLWEISGYSKHFCDKYMLRHKVLVQCKNIIHITKQTCEKLRIPYVSLCNRKMLLNPDTLPSETIDKAGPIKSLVSAYFSNVARKHSNKNIYYYYGTKTHSSDECCQTFTLKPVSTSIFGDFQRRVKFPNWIMYHELTNIKAPLIKTISAIEYEWIEGYLLRAKKLNLKKLCNVDSEGSDSVILESNKESLLVVDLEKSEKNKEQEKKLREEKINDAKTRYLERKRSKKSK